MRFLAGLALCGALLLVACAAPATTSEPDFPSDDSPDGEYVAVHDSASVSPICPDVNFYLADQVGANRSVGNTNYDNGDYCGALLFLRWVRNNDPLYTGGTPNDRTYWRLSDIYEQLAAASFDHPELRMAYFDSSRVMLEEAQHEMTEAGVPFNRAYYVLDEARFYETYPDEFPEKQDEVYDLYLEAFEIDPEIFQDAHLNRLASMAMERGDAAETTELIARLIPHADDPTYLQQAYDSASRPAFTTWAERLDQIMETVAEGNRDPQLIAEAIAIAFNEDRQEDLDILLPLYAEQNPTPELVCALASRAARSGRIEEAEQRLAQGITLSPSNALKRDCAYRVAASAEAGGNSGAAYRMAGQALQYDANHGRSLYLRASIVARTVRGGGVRARAAYWCFADMFNRVAATGDPAVAGPARQAAAGYNRAAPSQQEYFFDPGWRPGQRITASHGYGSCTTTVR
ncbi:MAG: hypothetical protein R3284_03660 [Rubricoccaceae bacterium]|nr:hypothetical protein [Rubricoccaceae bacterium]